MLKKVFILIFIVSQFIACDTIEDLQLVGSPQIEFEGISKDGLDLGLVVQIKNPNQYKFNIKKGDFKIWINGSEMGTAKLSRSVKIEANSNKQYTFPIKASLKGKDVSLMTLLEIGGGGSFKLKIDGEIKASTFLLISNKFDVEWEERVM